jgi:hypothetical protein
LQLTKQFNVMLDYDDKSAISMEVTIWKIFVITFFIHL